MRQLPGKLKLIRHRVSIANGAVIDSLSELFIFPNPVVNALGEADGVATVAGTAIWVGVAAGAPTGSSTLTGAAIRRVLPTGTTAGASGITGAAIRRAVATARRPRRITTQGQSVPWPRDLGSLRERLCWALLPLRALWH